MSTTVPIPRSSTHGASELEARHETTIRRLVAAFARQDLDAIMELFAESSVYCDVGGRGARGDEFRGKEAIRHSFLRQFQLLGPHTYENPTVVVSGSTAFTSWTLVLGDATDPTAPRFEGADHFELDDESRVTLKKAWLKGQPRLARLAFWRHPLRAMDHLRHRLVA